LQFNPSKAEVIWLGTCYRLQQLAGADLNLTIGTDVIKPLTVVRDLGVLTDAQLTLQQHVRKLTSSCFFHLRRIREVRKYVNRQVLKHLVHAFIISRLDYCNSILAFWPKCTAPATSSLKNAAAKIDIWSATMSHLIYINFTGYQSTTGSNVC